ncbi:hypothetical protein EJ110_NYTH54441, partial [Nymphaea thermarum]
ANACEIVGVLVVFPSFFRRPLVAFLVPAVAAAIISSAAVALSSATDVALCSAVALSSAAAVVFPATPTLRYCRDYWISLLPLILRKSTSYDMWTVLARMYGRKNRVLRTYQIKRSIYSLKQGDLSVASFFAALKTKWEELDYHVNDDWNCGSDHALYWEKEWMDRTFIFLGGLRDEFESIRSQILNCDEIPEIEEVYARGLDSVLLDGVAIATNWDILLTFVGIFILKNDLSGVVLLLVGGVLQCLSLSHRSWRREFFVDRSSWKLSSPDAVEVPASVSVVWPFAAAALVTSPCSAVDVPFSATVYAVTGAECAVVVAVCTVAVAVQQRHRCPQRCCRRCFQRCRRPAPPPPVCSVQQHCRRRCSQRCRRPAPPPPVCSFHCRSCVFQRRRCSHHCRRRCRRCQPLLRRRSCAIVLVLLTGVIVLLPGEEGRYACLGAS